MTGPFAADTSVVVAALLSWHDHHRAAARALEEAMEAAPLVLPAAALVESYAVLTRLPAPHRLAPADAHALLQQSFASSARVEGLPGSECWSLLASLAKGGVAGGRTYDAQILAGARRGGARVLLTFNVSDFEPLARLLGAGMAVRDPLAQR